MRQMLSKGLLCAALLTGGALLSPAVAEETAVRVGLGAEYSSGTYGTDTRTGALFIPLTVEVVPLRRWDVSIEIPYLYQTNTNVVAGQFGRTAGVQTTAVARPAWAGTGSAGGYYSSTSVTDTTSSAGGLGDITLRTGYLLTEGDGWLPTVRPNLFVKIPTADSDKGLGTGEVDGGVALEVSSWFGSWSAFIEPGYTVQGKPDDMFLKNYVSYTAGIGYQVTDSFRPVLIVKGSSARAEGAPSYLEGRAKFLYQFSADLGMEAYLARGFTDATPDYAAGVAFVRGF